MNKTHAQPPRGIIVENPHGNNALRRLLRTRWERLGGLVHKRQSQFHREYTPVRAVTNG
jgi:hypothetical protein